MLYERGRKYSHAAVAAGDDDIARHTFAVKAATFGKKQLYTIATGDETITGFWFVIGKSGVHLVLAHEVFGGSAAHGKKKR